MFICKKGEKREISQDWFSGAKDTIVFGGVEASEVMNVGTGELIEKTKIEMFEAHLETQIEKKKIKRRTLKNLF